MLDIAKTVSGGQTGADRGGLDAAASAQIFTLRQMASSPAELIFGCGHNN